MNKFFLSFIFIFLVSCFIFAEPPKLAFGSIYSAKEATAIPGANFSYDILFFVDSEYGNRVAHILLSVEKPEGWEVYIDPPARTYFYNVSGTIIESLENLYVEPRPKLPSIPEEKEEGIYYVSSPSGLGYLQAKKVTVYVKVPENVEIGKSFIIKVLANASYFGDSRNVAFSQSRDFTLKVITKAPEYYEKPLGQEIIANETKDKGIEETTAQDNQANASIQISQNQSVLLNYVIAIILLGVLMYILIKFVNLKKWER